MRFCFALLIGAALLAGCGAVTVPTPTTAPPLASPTPDQPPAPLYGRSSGEISTPLHVLLILSQAPRLGDTVQVTLVVTSTLPAPGASAEIILPPGVVVAAGVVTWTGDLQPQQPQRLQATIQFTQEGDFTLLGRALRPAADGAVWGDLAALYLHIAQGAAAQTGFPPEPNAPRGGGQRPPSPAPTTQSP